MMAPNEASSSPNSTQLSVTSVSLLISIIPPETLIGIQTTTDASAPAELSVVVDELLNSLSNKFAGVSSEIFAKSRFTPSHARAVTVDKFRVDEMSRRLDNLEATLQANAEGKDGRGSPTKA
jgi:heat shock factor-binding protein 1